MRREFSVGNQAQSTLVSALADIAGAVASTMGPGGMPFGFDKLGTDMRLTATFSKDGLTVLKSLAFNEPSSQAVLQYCRQAASHSVVASGDGTTSTIVLANAVAKAVYESKSKYPQAFARELEEDAKQAIAAIRQEAILGDDVVRQVAMTSTNGDEELTDVVLEAIKASSAMGAILVEKNPASGVRYKIARQDGYSNCVGYNYNTTFALSASPNAASSKPIEWENPHVLILNGNLLTPQQVDPILNAWNEKIVKTGKGTKLLILAYEVSDEVVNKLLVLNRKAAKTGAAVFVSKPRLTAEVNSGLQVIRDIAAFCGIDDDSITDGGNYKNIDESFFGTCKKVTITTQNTMFLGRAENHWVDKRIMQNASVIEEARIPFDKEITAARNAELAEGLVKVEVGGGLLPDLQERADRFDDASKAAKSCMAAGALPGGGSSYIRAGVLVGVHKSLETAFRAVYNNVLANYGIDPNPDFVPLRGIGVSIKDDKAITGDAKELGVLDACETVCAVIQNGVSLGVKIATIGGYIFRNKDVEHPDMD
jgi:chaperonin GroEL